ncbi:alpha/beta fold hydrolase [Cryobacterium sp. PAMC25264]|uniref:alpha/beta fold hydrolase n=1 Tax=Cryobacterium sp. PAMC25264 TaxID=2861288 RepID=UPI001C638E94|nr:alpha/beta hydrolase [Cryobacterium sp. PAMC25264]QYF74461.1 alpha/beta hydrolase [Cryobacterium sp. PAMC25264]
MSSDPGAGEFDPDPTATARWGVHLVMLDRPGYGATPPHEDDEPHTVQHRADDLAEFLDLSERTARTAGHTDYGSVGVIGWGTGGMVALSLAARYPDLVDKVAVVNTASPSAAALRSITPPPFTRWSLGVTPDDPALVKMGLDNRLDRMLTEAGLQGSAGVDCDRRMLSDSEWTKDLGNIQADVKLIYGDGDTTVTLGDGKWYRRRIPRARTVRVPQGGALTIASHWTRILAHVAPRHGGLSAAERLGTHAVSTSVRL